jgi:GWxTD domain-containing protein
VLLLESVLADTPVVLGQFRPVILAPLGFLVGLSPGQVEAILLHELAHIKRSDYLINICQRLIEGLLFYHPAVWWISGVIRREREKCCDDMVVALRGDAGSYAEALTALEENRVKQQWPVAAPAVAATGGDLIVRIKRLLYPKGPTGIWAPAIAAVLFMTSGATAVAAWHVAHNSGLAAQQPDKKTNDPWQKWLNEDVVYIIADEERNAFEHLTTDEERQHFVEQFWARRDPTPGTPENQFKEEHYRRIGFANNHWGGHLPGWQTDRGRIYIRYGPPDEIGSHPSGGSYKRPASEGGGVAVTYPFEDWRYAHFEGVGSLTVEFVDVSSSGEFRMTLNPNEKYRKP